MTVTVSHHNSFLRPPRAGTVTAAAIAARPPICLYDLRGARDGLARFVAGTRHIGDRLRALLHRPTPQGGPPSVRSGTLTLAEGLSRAGTAIPSVGFFGLLSLIAILPTLHNVNLWLPCGLNAGVPALLGVTQYVLSGEEFYSGIIARRSVSLNRFAYQADEVLKSGPLSEGSMARLREIVSVMERNLASMQSAQRVAAPFYRAANFILQSPSEDTRGQAERVSRDAKRVADYRARLNALSISS